MMKQREKLRLLPLLIKVYYSVALMVMCMLLSECYPINILLTALTRSVSTKSAYFEYVSDPVST